MPAPESVRLFNTLSRTVEPLNPMTPGEVKVYCCGPTVYHYAHIGNLRAYIFEDLLVRTLRQAGYTVNHVMNITDVGHLVGDGDEGEDKMLVAMRREGKSSLQIAQFYTDAFFKDTKRLSIEMPTIVCKATEHIQEMIALIQRLEAQGMTYIAGGNVYFDVSKLADYGKLARLDLDKLRAGARIEVDSNKRNAQDFVLWFTKSKFEGQELQWDSPWGRGYPGWHIECSAMSIKYLGEEFDIHCGGIDHIPVHHTNEIAQSEGATGKPWVKIWMHGEFLVSDKGKMSKSSGSFTTLQSLVDAGYDPLAYRVLCLSAHYRTQLSWGDEALKAAAQTLERMRGAVLKLKNENPSIQTASLPRVPQFKAFGEAMRNDLNAPQALAQVWDVLNDSSLQAADKLAALYAMDKTLGLGMAEWKEREVEVPTEVSVLLEARKAARAAKNWGESDRIRGEITKLGFAVEDAGGTQKVKKS
jgi:cysteinyl-tRNA synthetase